MIASSETTYGVCFAEGDKDFHSFPLEEDYDIDPMDSYGLSKVCNEKTAPRLRHALRRRHLRAQDRQRDRAARIRPQFRRYVADPPMRKRNAWSYIDARDLGEIVRLCLEKDGLGFQVFNATNDTITLDMPTGRGAEDALPEYAGHPCDGRVRGAAVEPQGARGARFQGDARLVGGGNVACGRTTGDGMDALVARARSMTAPARYRRARPTAPHVPRGFARLVGAAAAGSSGQKWRG